MDAPNYSPKDAKILRENPDATIPQLRELGISNKGAERREAELLKQADAPKPKGVENVEVVAEPKPTVTPSTVTAPTPVADAPLKPQLSPANPTAPAPVAAGSVFKQVRVKTPTGEVEVSEQSAKFLLSQPGYSLV